MGIGRAFVLWCVLMLSYLLLAGATSANEIGAGAVACLLVVLVARAIHSGERRIVRARPPIRVLLKPLLAVLTDTVRVAAALFRAIVRRPAGRAGRIVSIPFRSGRDRPDDAGRRGVVTLAASLAPNGFVLFVPDGRDMLVMHTLVPARVPDDRDWPV